MKKVFITDLDRTMVHSENPDFICVEKEGERKITYMTKESINHLNELLSRKDFVFVPCSMRNYAQTMRINFISNNMPRYMICENGAKIYVDGNLDEKWSLYMRSIINSDYVIEGINKIKALKYNFRDIKNIDDFYIAVSFYDEKESDASYSEISSIFSHPYNVFKVGRKIFIIHNKIDKYYAVKYLVENYDIKCFITSGDTEVDKKFTRLGKCVLPKHASFTHDNAYITSKPGIHSTDEILDFVDNFFYGNEKNIGG